MPGFKAHLYLNCCGIRGNVYILAISDVMCAYSDDLFLFVLDTFLLERQLVNLALSFLVDILKEITKQICAYHHKTSVNIHSVSLLF